MTDDPRLEVVKLALERVMGIRAPDDDALYETARETCAMIRAFLGEDAERKEVMPHPEPRPAQHNATASVAAGADPLPWPVSAAQVEAAVRVLSRWLNIGDSSIFTIARAALEAAAKVRAGG